MRASRALHGAVLAGASLALVLLFVSSAALAPSVGASSQRLPTVSAPPSQAPAAQLPPGADSPTYLANNNRDIFGPQEKLINASSASSLQLLWSFNQTGALESEPVTSAGVVYIGSISGYEYALNALTGQVLWKRYLGVDVNDTLCGTTALGIVSTPTISGNSMLVYGGNAVLYDLNKENGRVQWQLSLGNTSQGYFGWGSPLVIGAYAFIGAASRCDKPLIPGGLFEVSLTSHKEIAFFNTTSPGLVGNSIWSTPSYNPSTATVFVTTGNQNGTNPRGLGESILAINASSMQLRASWQVPSNQSVVDSDFGSTPTLFTPKGGFPMVCALNKNGILYAWYQSNLTLAWERHISFAISVASVSWSGSHLYVLGPNTTIGTSTYSSAIRELNPLTGAVQWQKGLTTAHSGYASPLWSDGALVVAESSSVELLASSNAKVLVTLPVTGKVNAPPTVSRGELFVATTYGYLYAYDVALRAPFTAAPAVGGLSSDELNLSAGAWGGLPAYSYNWSFGDGSFGSGSVTQHLYSGPGNYTVALRVIDLSGSSASTSATETVA